MSAFLTSEKTEEKIRSELTGNTLRVYWLMLKSQNGEVGMREIQRSLKFSSPNLALHHLEKLRRLGLIEKRDASYHLVKEVKVDTVRQFMRLGTMMVPRYLFSSVLFTILLVYFLLNVQVFNFYTVYALIFGICGAVIFWFETIKVLKDQP
jgi:hypothetical protein